MNTKKKIKTKEEIERDKEKGHDILIGDIVDIKIDEILNKKLIKAGVFEVLKMNTGVVSRFNKLNSTIKSDFFGRFYQSRKVYTGSKIVKDKNGISKNKYIYEIKYTSYKSSSEYLNHCYENIIDREVFDDELIKLVSRIRKDHGTFFLKDIGDKILDGITRNIIETSDRMTRIDCNFSEYSNILTPMNDEEFISKMICGGILKKELDSNELLLKNELCKDRGERFKEDNVKLINGILYDEEE